MKQIELKRVMTSGEVPLDYRELIILIAKNHPHGITIDQMTQALKVIRAAEKASGVLKLEDADWATLKDYLSVYPFGTVDEALIQFKQDIEHASEAEIK